MCKLTVQTRRFERLQASLYHQKSCCYCLLTVVIHLKSPFCGFVLVGWRGIFCSHPQTFQSSPHQKSPKGFHPNNLLGAGSPEPGAAGLVWHQLPPTCSPDFPLQHPCLLLYLLFVLLFEFLGKFKYHGNDCRLDFCLTRF